MIETIIVHNDPIAVEILKDIIAKEKDFDVLDAVTSLTDTVTQIRRLKPDLIFVDGELKKMKGIELVKKLDPSIDIILMSDNPADAVGAFDVEAIDFLSKPLKEPRVVTALNKARSHSSKNRNDGYLFLKDNGKHHKVRISDILYVQADADYVKIHTKERRYTILKTLTKMLEKLEPHGFIKIHKSYIADMYKIEFLDHEKKVVIIDGVEIPFSRRLKTTVIKQLKSRE